jgi:3-phosphoshikimate 1-carboxyvinyltransferase
VSNGSKKFRVEPGGSLSGSFVLPGDKSISHRSIMLGSLAKGTTEVTGFLQGADSLATLEAFRAMGVKISDPAEGALTITGVGLHGLKPAGKALDVGNSGTSMRLLAGILSGQSFDSELIGDDSLSRRPMSRVAAPLSLMGARVDTGAGGTPPLHIQGGKNLVGIEYPMPMASAQVKSCLLLAGLYAQGETAVIEPAATRDHTERMLRAFGVEVVTQDSRASLLGGQELQATSIQVPADISSATFFIVASAISKNSEVRLLKVGVNPTRDGIIHILRLMGADIEMENQRLLGDEPVADILVRSSPLQAIDIPEHLVPLAIDEFPAVFVAAACASGTTRLTGAAELRVKETDRIQVMADGLKILGIKCKVLDDGIEITGGLIKGGKVDSCGDHRTAMSFAIAALRSQKPIEILDCDNVATSFPNFVELASSAGLGIQEL